MELFIWSRFHGDYAKDIPTANNFSGEVTVKTPSFVAQPGDVVVFNEDFGSGAGHTAIVLNGNADGNVMQFTRIKIGMVAALTRQKLRNVSRMIMKLKCGL